MSANNSIAKNTLFLYFRMIIIMGVQLFTVRVVLSTLGVVDYGLYNVVGGIVSMFAFFTSTMTTAAQRYFAYDIGRGDNEQLRKTFGLTFIIYMLMGLIILILGETIGLWALNYKLSIPHDRFAAANWIYQFSIMTFLLTMFKIPYDAIVIAREKMNIFAYVSILEVILKLLIVYLLTVLPYDKLIVYGCLSFSVTLVITTIYRVYCLRTFKESHFKYYWNKPLFKEILSYSGWNLFGSSASMMNNQGINVVLNVFFGPVVNAARAIAFQINMAINNFAQNFMTATRPQITKYYAQKEMNKMLNLVFQSSKFTYFLLYIISLPVIIEMPFILQIWLKSVPQHTVLFGRIIMITALIDSLSLSLITAVQATGRIRNYQAIVGTLIILNVPISYLLLKQGFPPETALWVVFCCSVVCLVLRLYLFKAIISELSIINFIKKVLLPVFIITLFTIFPFFIEIALFKESWLRFISNVILSVFFTVVLIYLLGITKNEKQLISNFLKKKMEK